MMKIHNSPPKTIWLNGEFVPWENSLVHVLTHTLHYGIGCFEGVRAYKTPKGSAIFRLEDHTNRLFSSAHIADMRIPFSKEEIFEAQKNLLKKNELASAYIRPMCFYGESMGLHMNDLPVQIMIAAWEWGPYLGKEKLNNGLRVLISSHTRNNVNSTFCKAKINGNYVNSAMAIKEAQRYGCDEALLLDHQGYVAEGSGANFFMVKNGIIYTPDTAAILPGITRDTIIQIAQEQEFLVQEKRITRDEVYIAEEAFFTGTAAEVTPIIEVDGRKIGTGSRGVITKQLQQSYFDLVQGIRSDQNGWLSHL